VSEVVPNFKDNWGMCSCQCGEGELRKVRADGSRCVRGCRCKRCQGGRNRTGGLHKQRMARKALGIPATSSIRSGQEETWPGTIRAEVKSGAIVKPAVTAYLKMRLQSEASKALGDNRPFVGVAMPTGESWGVVLVSTRDLDQFVAAYAEQRGWLA
jgi:hypothetical protein